MNTKLKRISAVLSVLLILLSLLGCGKAGLHTETEDIITFSTETYVKPDLPETDGTTGQITAAEETTEPESTTEETDPAPAIAEDGQYTSKDDVALYIHTYGKLPSNFITKEEARDLGWSSGGLDKYAYGKSIGGDYFGNYEGLLPKAKGRTYTECDIDTMHKNSRGAKRIIFSNDGLIFYTDDHYESFTQLY